MLFSVSHNDVGSHSGFFLTLLSWLLPLGFFFLLSWSLFTYQHREEISQDFSSLGSSYWLGAFGWVLLLVVETIVFIAEQAIVPDILPDLEKAVESWRITSQLQAAKRSFSDGCYSAYSWSETSIMLPSPWVRRRNKDMATQCCTDVQRTQLFIMSASPTQASAKGKLQRVLDWSFLKSCCACLSVCLERGLKHSEKTLKSNDAIWKKNCSLSNQWESVYKDFGVWKCLNTKVS